MVDKHQMLEKYEGNPIISPKDFPGADAVFNCGQTMYEGKTILLLSIILSGDPTPRIHIAESSDGINFTIHPEPFITRAEEEPFRSLDFWVIDPRVTRIGDTYYIVRPGNSDKGVISLLEKTTDFKSRELIDIIALPDNRVPCLFPEKIDGSYVRLDRPYAPGAPDTHGHIWISYSPDLIHWGHHRFLIGPSWAMWNSYKVGPTPPIKTDKGWLVIIHGVAKSCAGVRYSLGALLLDLKDPSKIIGKTEEYILTPDKTYEFQGNIPNVVFSCGAIADYEEDRLRIYYGAADTCIGLATGSLSYIVDACLGGE